MYLEEAVVLGTCGYRPRVQISVNIMMEERPHLLQGPPGHVSHLTSVLD